MHGLQQQIVSLRPSKVVVERLLSNSDQKIVTSPNLVKKPSPIPSLNDSHYKKAQDLAQQMAKETAEQFLANLPDILLNQLSEKQRENWCKELAHQLEPSLSSQLSWALNQVWLDVKEIS